MSSQSASQQWVAALESALSQLVGFLWGMPLVLLLMGGGLFFLLYSRFLPYRYLSEGLRLLFQKQEVRKPDDHAHGQLSHFQALSTALSGTLGMGNVGGVAIAIAVGGPGAIFWMWVSAVIGIATKFYTCSLAVMFRGKDSEGQWQGGPMYVVREGLGTKWLPLAYFFAIAGLLGTMPIFQINQLVQILRETIAVPMGITNNESHFNFDLILGLILASLVVAVALGELRRLGRIASVIVPSMVAMYLLLTLTVLISQYEHIPAIFALIFTDAFSGQAAAGGAIGAVIITGIRRAAFSNEAGIGTEAMAHGAARTRIPIHEGMVAMLGPVIDTLIVCTCTALVILVSGVWQQEQLNGATMTVQAFDTLFPGGGAVILAVLASFLSMSTVFTFWYYGAKCLGFLIGAKYQHHYIWFYAILAVLGSIASLKIVVSIVDSMYALMAIPTMTSALLLAPKVNAAVRAHMQSQKLIH